MRRGNVNQRVLTWSICGVLLLAPGAACAQTSLSVGTARTELESAALRLAIRTAKNLWDYVSITPSANRSTARGVAFAPSVELLTGEADALNGMVAKLSGNYYPSLQLSNGGKDIEPVQNFWVVPVSAGIEADRAFDTVNALFEVGFTRVFRKGLLAYREFDFGVYAQAGQKWAPDSALVSPEAGGAGDQSEEEPDEVFGRAKAEIGYSQDLFSLPVGEDGAAKSVQLRAAGTGWWDVVNSTTYFRVEGALKLPLGDKESFDLKFERGSGAPNFNKGDQFSANLVVTF
jgi:hypothetical protein